MFFSMTLQCIFCLTKVGKGSLISYYYLIEYNLNREILKGSYLKYLFILLKDHNILQCSAFKTNALFLLNSKASLFMSG